MHWRWNRILTHWDGCLEEWEQPQVVKALRENFGQVLRQSRFHGKTGQGRGIVSIPRMLASEIRKKVKRFGSCMFEKYGEVDAEEDAESVFVGCEQG